MPRSPFEETDRRAASRMAELHGEPCTWQPMIFRSAGGDRYTNDRQAEIDPARPRRQDLVAIVTWRSGVARDEGNSVAGGQLVVDIERMYFDKTDEYPDGFIPQKGDRFELPDQDEGEQLVEIGRKIDDGGASILYACILVVP